MGELTGPQLTVSVGLPGTRVPTFTQHSLIINNASPRLPLFLIHIYHHSPDGESISADSTVRSSPLPSFQLHHVHGVGGVELSFNADVRERRAQRQRTRHALDSQHCNTANTAPAPPSWRRWTPALAASQAQPISFTYQIWYHGTMVPWYQWYQ